MQATLRRRLAAAFVLAVLALACVGFWVGVPLGVLWALSKVTHSFAGHFVLGLLLVPPAMVAASPVLFWLNGLYLRITEVPTASERHREPELRPRLRARGPLEPMLLASLLVALVALTIWFAVAAEEPPSLIFGAAAPASAGPYHQTVVSTPSTSERGFV